MRPNLAKTLRANILERRALLVPGVANALAARVVEDLDFEAVYLSGAGLTNTLWGMPDLGFMTVPSENSVQPTSDAIPRGEPQSPSSLRPSLGPRMKSAEARAPKRAQSGH